MYATRPPLSFLSCCSYPPPAAICAIREQTPTSRNCEERLSDPDDAMNRCVYRSLKSEGRAHYRPRRSEMGARNSIAENDRYSLSARIRMLRDTRVKPP